MPDVNQVPDIYEQLKKWVFDHFGVPGLAGLSLLAAAIYAYKNWDKVKKWPGVASIIAYKNRWPVPQGDNDRFSIIVARLENDSNREHEYLIVEALKEFQGVQVLSLDRTIALKGPVPEEMEKRGHEDARNFLLQSGASVLIWGMVLSGDGGTILKLRWTITKEKGKKWGRYDAPKLQEQLRLPELFWSDLAEILRLLVTFHYAEFCAQEGHYIADRLPSFIARVRILLEGSGGRPGWDADTRCDTLMIMANALYLLGEQSCQSKPLKDAVAAYREVLKERTRWQAPMDWAGTQNNLGNVLRILGEQDKGTGRLEEAVDAHRNALKVWNRKGTPLDWARAQTNLGSDLLCLGIRRGDASHLEEAAAACRQALQEFTRDRAPLNWAITQNNLGIALRNLGEREGRTERLEDSVEAFRKALTECTRDRFPLEWARIQNNLGLVLWNLGQRKSGTGFLEEAVAAYREALKERTRERMPLDWAATQNNLGLALSGIGERESGITRLEEAVVAFREALKEISYERVPMQWALTMNNLGGALSRLWERESETIRMEEAADTFRKALKVFEESQATYYIERTKANLRRAEAIILERLK